MFFLIDYNVPIDTLDAETYGSQSTNFSNIVSAKFPLHSITLHHTQLIRHRRNLHHGTVNLIQRLKLHVRPVGILDQPTQALFGILTEAMQLVPFLVPVLLQVLLLL